MTEVMLTNGAPHPESARETVDGGAELRAEPYKVGRNRPPLDTRIKPGEVRNPHGCKGKPKPKKKAVQEMAFGALDKALARPVKARKSNGATARMTAGEALMTKVVNDALAGNERAQRQVWAMLRDKQKVLPTQNDIPQGVVVIPAPARDMDEWFDRYSDYKPTNNLKDLPGYDKENHTFNGIKVNPETGEFIKDDVPRRRGA